MKPRGLIFDEVKSTDFGMIIAGDTVYNAPTRRYNMIQIPGRNGDLAIDDESYENIPVTYPSAIHADTQEEFAKRMRNIKNAILSKSGYRRLMDSYHPDEFRMGIYKSGLEVDPYHFNENGKFDLIFDCKPQRFLTSGEEEINVDEWGPTETETGDIVSFEAEANTGIKSLVVDIDPIQEGSGEPSPTNVRPISGCDEVNTVRTGKNLLWNIRADSYTTNGITFTKKDGKVIANGTATANAYYRMTDDFVFKAPSILSGCPQGGSASTYEIQIDGTYIKDYGNGVNVSAGVGNGRIYILIISGVIADNLTFEPMVRLATETDDTFEPYQGESITTDLGQTVYGGKLDVVSGVLTLERVKVTLNGSQTMAALTNARWQIAVDNFVAPATNVQADIICDKLKSITYNSLSTTDFAISGGQTGTTNLGIRIGSDYNARADVVSWLQTNTPTVVYPLATPQTIQLTPQQVTTLLGANNIWADSGEVTVEFGDDPSILVNPTAFKSRPMIIATGSGTLTIGDVAITIAGEAGKDIYIDCEAMEAYSVVNGEAVSKNDKITLSGNDFPKLGDFSKVNYTGLSAVKVIPRWWTL